MGPAPPALLRINAVPPGWKRANLVTSYTLSSMMIQLLASVLWAATSARVNTAVAAVVAAAAAIAARVEPRVGARVVRGWLSQSRPIQSQPFEQDRSLTRLRRVEGKAGKGRKEVRVMQHTVLVPAERALAAKRRAA